jgi:hypothetical protein
MRVGDLVRDKCAQPESRRYSEVGLIVSAAGIRPLVLWPCGEVTVEWIDNLKVISKSGDSLTR